jgi:hypothetical protein
MGFLVDLWVKLLNPFLKGLWDSISFWRIMTLGIITISFLFKKQLKKLFLKPNRIEHDKTIFKRSDNVMNEGYLLNLLDVVGTYYGYSSNSWRSLDLFSMFFQETSNQYLMKKLQKVSLKLVSSLNSLSTFCALQFFHQEGNLDYLKLQPEIQFSLESEKEMQFQQLTQELDKLIELAEKDYEKYRVLIKKELNL